MRLLDARRGGLDERALREWARELTDAAGAPYSSRSYRFLYSFIAWHRQRVGVDIERIEPLDEAFLDSISTPTERRRSVDESETATYATSLWCSKEALAKALGDALGYDARRLDSPMFWPAGESGPWRALALPAPIGHTAWLCLRDEGETR